ncbi:hypothetical protein ETD83_17620 [Actinomadura soli]|uniref:Uncharacterized protein n=1 Tax=Actinomadura soli TaxID=2508997 RepID=A0A5C4JBR0_9ACTN|nr:CU044_5270 family protein [Actinomadura soli]TMQ99987.1 hypothetical protein ETD83_17620 [Actinomadura soli]
MNDDVLRTLREARPAELDPDVPVDARVRQMELARAMAAGPGPDGARTRKAGRRRVRPVWGIGLSAAVAAGVLAAVIVVPSGDDGAGTPRAGHGAGQLLDAKTVLLTAAEKADGRTDTMRAYWHTVTISSHTHTVGQGDGRYSVTVRERHETWTPGDPGGKVYGREQYLGAKPATAADEAAWRRAGSPGTFELRIPISPGSKITKPYRAKLAPASQQPPKVSVSPLVDGDKVFWLGRNVTMRQLRSLPSDPKRLKAELIRWYEGHDTESDRPMGAAEWLYRVASGMVMSMPVPPEVRAAGFRMLAGLPGVRSAGRVTDPQGRAGDAIAVDDTTPGGVIRDQMIIDLASGTALARGNVMVKAVAGSDVPTGRTMSSEVVLTAEWTDSAPR